MNRSLQRILLSWADSPWNWLPFTRLRPPPHQPIPAAWIALHALSGMVWFGLPILLAARGILGRWSAPAFLIPGLVGLIAALMWHLMLRAAWNRRAASLAATPASQDSAPGSLPAPPAPATRLNPLERWVLQPLLVLLVLYVAITFVYGVENLRGALALRALHRDLQAQGLPIAPADLLPPPVPDDRNLAVIPLFSPLFAYDSLPTGIRWHDTNAYQRAQKAFTYEDPRTPFQRFAKDRGTPVGAWPDGQRLDLAVWQAYFASLPDRPEPNPDASPGASVLAALDPLEDDLDQLRSAARSRPESLFPLHYEEGFHMLLPHMAVLRRTSELLRLRAVALLSEDRTDEALAETLLALRLSDAIRNEPILISLLVRVVIDRTALQSVWEGCLDRRWNESQLRTLQQAFATRRYLDDMATVLHGERVFGSHTYDVMVRGGDPLRTLLGMIADNDHSFASFIRFIPRGWIRQNQVAHSRHLGVLVDDLQRAPSHAALPPGDERLLQTIDRRSPFTIIAGMLLPALAKSHTRAYHAEAVSRLALAGLALERHRLAEGRYPDRLDALVPRFLESVPIDPMDGQPLRYRLTDTGDFQLYSVGEDHRDDHGTRPRPGMSTGTHAPRSGDLVWR
ncbi:MAG: hypothetical protein KF833_00495 [Verrucomicrobiae bacterium]|nr:hypothetical protein [Verrucomicrobiae bacterium]